MCNSLRAPARRVRSDNNTTIYLEPKNCGQFAILIWSAAASTSGYGIDSVTVPGAWTLTTPP
jgi:hypothetical protein